jgi:putative PLP-dependent aminotransferase (TIGR04422 family)
VPSGRSAISIILRTNGLSRGDSVFAPRFSSNCVWDAISHTADPCNHFHPEVDAAIAVHKWGQVHKFSEDNDFLIIEDSVDSLFISNDTLFPNGGRYEVVSLPKIIGSYTGGLILVRDSNDASKLSNLQADNAELGRYQSRLRFQSKRDSSSKFCKWRHLEHQNTYLDLNAVVNIKKCLDNYVVNRDIIQDRLIEITKRTQIKYDPTRLPPLVAFSEYENNDNNVNILLSRHVNRSKLLDKPMFQVASLLPIHFGISDKDFENALNNLII